MPRGIPNDVNSGLTVDRLRDVLDYDTNTGIFTWKIDTGKRRLNGKIAGSKSEDYWEICIDYTRFKAHRLAWLYVYGVWPSRRDIDHINGDKLDNRIENLREAHRGQNNANSGLSVRNTSGCKGVAWHKQVGKWRAYIREGGRIRHLGLFETFEDACRVRKAAELRIFGEFSGQAAA